MGFPGYFYGWIIERRDWAWLLERIVVSWFLGRSLGYESEVGAERNIDSMMGGIAGTSVPFHTFNTFTVVLMYMWTSRRMAIHGVSIGLMRDQHVPITGLG